MSRIYIYSPSGAVLVKSVFRRGVKRLQALGHEVEVDDAALARHMRFAGEDEVRVAAIHRAAASGADVALISRGGYGISRLLPAIDLRKVAKAVERGTKFVGLSDFTALQCALLAKNGARSWAGPALLGDFGREGDPDEIMLACFEDLLAGRGEGAGWSIPRTDAPKSIAKNPGGARSSGLFHCRNATLWGGNLAMLCSLVGTPWMPQVKGGVLFLEDANEPPFRIERMLLQLLHAGVLGAQKAIVLGQFTDYRVLAAYERGFKLATVVERLRAQLKIPVVTGLPFGHVPTKVLLPVGAKVEFAVEDGEALIYWGHLH